MKRTGKRWLYLTAVALTAVLVIGCGGGGEKKLAEDASKKDTLTVALPSEPLGLVGSQVGTLVSNIPICNIAEGLITVTPDGAYEPLLADKYEQIDEKSYRFYLKKGVKFHNGDEMKAEDVVYSLHEAALSPSVKHASAAIDPDGFEIEDDYTVIIRTTEAYAPIIACLSHSANSIISAKAWKEKGEDFVRNPVGTGPFKFVSWTSGESIVLERFEEYHGEKAKTKNLVFRIMPEAASRVVELESGGVDVIGDVPINDLKRFKESNGKFNVYSKPGMRIYPIIMNQQSELFSNKTLRQAMRYATNVDDMISVVWEGGATHVDTVMPPSIDGYTEEVTKYDYNPEKAKELMAEAGYPDGFTCKLITSEASENVKLAEVLQAQWKEIGVSVEIDQMENAAWLTRQNNLDFDLTVCPTNNSVGDADGNFTKMFLSANIGNAGNFAAYKSPDADKLILSARAESNPEKRREMYKQLQQIIADDAVWIPASVPDLQVVTGGNVKGFNLYANNTQRYKDTYKE